MVHYGGVLATKREVGIRNHSVKMIKIAYIPRFI